MSFFMTWFGKSWSNSNSVKTTGDDHIAVLAVSCYAFRRYPFISSLCGITTVLCAWVYVCVSGWQVVLVWLSYMHVCPVSVIRCPVQVECRRLCYYLLSYFYGPKYNLTTIVRKGSTGSHLLTIVQRFVSVARFTKEFRPLCSLLNSDPYWGGGLNSAPLCIFSNLQHMSDENFHKA